MIWLWDKKKWTPSLDNSPYLSSVGFFFLGHWKSLVCKTSVVNLADLSQQQIVGCEHILHTDGIVDRAQRPFFKAGTR